MGISESTILISQSSNKPQLNQLEGELRYILTREILIKLVLTLPFISQKNLNQLKLFYPGKET